MTLTKPGTVASPAISAPESGFYTWVWSIDKAKEGGNGKYLTGSFPGSARTGSGNVGGAIPAGSCLARGPEAREAR